jgi:hypothetical protein
MERIIGSLEARCIKLDSASIGKIVALKADLSLPDFGVGEAMMEQFRVELTLML